MENVTDSGVGDGRLADGGRGLGLREGGPQAGEFPFGAFGSAAFAGDVPLVAGGSVPREGAVDRKGKGGVGAPDIAGGDEERGECAPFGHGDGVG